jgi:cell division protein FtsB
MRPRGTRAGRPAGAAGRAPKAGRDDASRRRRSRAGIPTRTQRPAVVRARRANLTARAAILAVALASVALALALPFKIWVAQRGQIHALQSQTKAQQRHVVQLRQQEQRWNDPAYIKQQARLRLHYAMPGETTYVVLGKPKAHRHHPAATTTSPTLTGPWYSRLWESVQAAGKGASVAP